MRATLRFFQRAPKFTECQYQAMWSLYKGDPTPITLHLSSRTHGTFLIEMSRDDAASVADSIVNAITNLRESGL